MNAFKNIILSSAKRKLDYPWICDEFPFDPSFIIIEVIEGFVSVKTPYAIEKNLYSSLRKRGYGWKKNWLTAFVRECERLLCIEIRATQLAADMLKSGYCPIFALWMVYNACNNSYDL